MKRVSYRQPGYDCLHAPCTHEPKSDHGIHGGRYFWSVVADEGDLALTLSIFANEYPETIPASKRERLKGHARADLQRGEITGGISVHAAFPTSREEQVNGPGACDVLPGGSCFGIYDTAIGLAEFVHVLMLDAEGLPTFEQGEPLWAALGTWLGGHAPGFRAEKFLGVECPTCHGQGWVQP